VAIEKPEIGVYVQLSYYLSTPVLTAIAIDFDYAIEHQHIVYWQFGVTRAE
jgi:hypothetical protein